MHLSLKLRCLPWIQSICELQLGKQNKTKKQQQIKHIKREINKTFNLYLETDIEVTACLLRQMAVTWPQHFLSLSIDILRQLVHLHQFVLVDGDGSEW